MEGQSEKEMKYKPSKELIEALIRFEGMKNEPYTCPAGYWTIGIGSRYDLAGNQVTKNTKPINKHEAIKLLNNTILEIHRVLLLNGGSVFTAYQIEAFIELAFNIGYPTLIKTRLYNNAKKGVNVSIEDFTQFCHYRSNGLLVESKQLKQRRIFDWNMFIGAVNRTF